MAQFVTIFILLFSFNAYAQTQQEVEAALDKIEKFEEKTNYMKNAGKIMVIAGTSAAAINGYAMRYNSPMQRRLMHAVYKDKGYPRAILVQLGSFATIAIGGLVYFFSSTTDAQAATRTGYFASPEGFSKYLEMPRDQQLFYSGMDKKLGKKIIQAAAKIDEVKFVPAQEVNGHQEINETEIFGTTN